MSTDADPIDVLIIGGGPAGTTAGTLLARRGYRVVLLEKDRHPKFHIGESLLPMNLPILERLGVSDAVAEIGVPKMGADFTGDDADGSYRTYHFSRALGDTPGSAYEVKREEFDQILFRNCQSAGVETHERERVIAVEPGAGRQRVTSRDAEGNERLWQPRFVIDASGRDAFMAAHRGARRKNPRHASAAIFGHFRGVSRRPGTDAGNISVYWHPHGWMWMIPLRDDVMSVGAVCWPEYLKTRRGSTEDFLDRTLSLCPQAEKRMAGAERISPIRVAANYTYESSQSWGDGYLCVGDAYAFIDPVFSSGVYLAMSSAERSLTPVEAWLEQGAGAYRREARRFVAMTNRGLRGFSWFIYRFTSPAMQFLFRNPRNILQVEDAVVSMLSGDVYTNTRVNRRLMMFKLIYGISWLMTFRESLAARRKRLRIAAEPADETLEVA